MNISTFYPLARESKLGDMFILHKSYFKLQWDVSVPLFNCMGCVCVGKFLSNEA